MRKIFLTLAVLVMVICASAQKNQYFWYQGNLMLGNPIAQIDSVTFGEEDTDSILLYLPRTITKTIVVHDTMYVTIHDTICPNNNPEGALPGGFSIAADKKVRFSKGNLQCIMKDSTWRFADNQWEFIGPRNIKNETWGDTIDLFGYSTDLTYFGISLSEDDSSYEGNCIDWGNVMQGNWYTLSGAEWNYILFSRENHDNLKAVGSVNGVNGCILLPDSWNLPQGLSFTPGVAQSNATDDYRKVNEYSLEDWKRMEAAGAVFFPSANIRRANRYDNDSYMYFGRYWARTRTYRDSGQAHSFGFEANNITSLYDVPHYGFSVRLVQDFDNTSSDAEHPTIIHDTVYIPVHDTIYIPVHDTVCPNDIQEGALNGVFTIAADKTVRFSKGNLQYQASTNTWRFAEKQYDAIGNGNNNIGDTYDGWIDLFGWGTGNNPTLSSTDYLDYSTFTDWGINSIANGGNKDNIWRTLSFDEWNYLVNTRENANSLRGSACVNGVNGYVLLPDNWTTPQGLSFTALPDNWMTNNYSTTEWSLMEASGALFLPASSYRNGKNFGELGTHGYYWSTTIVDESHAFCFDFDEYFTGMYYEMSGLANGQSVRLVQDIVE